MNADNYFQSDEILNIINKNYNEKIANLRVLNSFKTLYDITGKYEKNDKSEYGYKLVDDYHSLFSLSGEKNSEVIFSCVAEAGVMEQKWFAHVWLVFHIGLFDPGK